MVATYAFVLAGVLIPFGLGAFLSALVALEEAKDVLKKINELAKSEKNRIETLHYIGDFIQYHARIIQLSDLTSKFHNHN